MNNNESLKLIIKARIDSREMNDFVSKFAIAAVDSGESLPEELADLFTLEVFTRPSGSKYGVLDFA
jgi:hypothetical protein